MAFPRCMCAERQCSSISLPSFKGTTSIKATLLQFHVNLIASQRPHPQVPSYWESELQHINFGIEHTQPITSLLCWSSYSLSGCCCCSVASVVSDSVWPHRQQPTRLPCPRDSPGKNTGVGCHFLLQFTKVKSESEATQSCPTLSDPMDCSPPGSSVHADTNRYQ